MSLSFASVRVLLCAALFFFASVPLGAQAAAHQEIPAPSAQNPSPTSGPAPIPMEQEGHHHLVFQNAYVKVFYVEIPAHDSTLYHHHDLPYLSLPPPPPLAEAPSSTARGRAPTEHSAPSGPRVSYALGGFSHTVTNSRDVTLRNIAVELVRPQGTARNRCEQVIRDQPLGDCDGPVPWSSKEPLSRSGRHTLFETDEITVEQWDVGPDAKIAPADMRLSTLLGGMQGIVNVILNGDARPVPQAGLIWLLSGSKTALETEKDSPGHFVTIVFKDSALKQ